MANYHSYPAKPKREPIDVKSVLGSVLKKQGLEAKFAQYDFVLYWSQIVGPEIAKRTRPEQIRNGVLIVSVVNSIWAQELSFNKRMILTKLQDRLVSSANGRILKDVQFCVSQDAFR